MFLAQDCTARNTKAYGVLKQRRQSRLLGHFTGCRNRPPEAPSVPREQLASLPAPEEGADGWAINPEVGSPTPWTKWSAAKKTLAPVTPAASLLSLFDTAIGD